MTSWHPPFDTCVPRPRGRGARAQGHNESVSPDVLSFAATRTPAIPTGPAFDIVLLAHVSCVVIGLLTVVVSGTQASRLLAALGRESGASPQRSTGSAAPARRGSPSAKPRQTSPDPGASRELSLGRYYAPGTNWAGRTLYGVPIFGFLLLGLSHGAYGLDQGWVMSGLGLWAAAAGGAEALLWPTERRIGVLLDARPRGQGTTEGVGGEALTGADRPSLLARVPVRALRRAGRTAQILSALLVVALVLAAMLMVAQP